MSGDVKNAMFAMGKKYNDWAPEKKKRLINDFNVFCYRGHVIIKSEIFALLIPMYYK